MRIPCSKWAKIARSKGANDAARSIVFSKMSVAISAACRSGGSDPVTNLRLAAAVEKARAANVPKDVIERAIAAGANTVGLEEVVIEVLGPGGGAILVETLTSNRKRTLISVRHILGKHECDVGATVAFMFESRGRVTVPFSGAADADALLELAADAEAQDVEFDEEASVGYVWTNASTVHSVRKALEEGGRKPTATEVIRFPTTSVDIAEEAEEMFGSLIAALEEHEDVQAVYHNANG